MTGSAHQVSLTDDVILSRSDSAPAAASLSRGLGSNLYFLFA